MEFLRSLTFTFDLDSIGIALIAGAFALFLVQIIYYLFLLSKPSRYHSQERSSRIDATSDKPPVSVIICAKNETQNLERFLPGVLQQDYPQFEVIVVNDGSTDETVDLLNQLEGQYPNLYQTYIPNQAKGLSRRKLAVTVGIKAAKYDILLFTEANCQPLSKDWISLMCRHFSPRIDLVLGFNTFSKSTGLFTKYASFDNLFCGLQYLSLAIIGDPYMGVGRNLAYKKEMFFMHKGFSKWLNLHAGEDDLFVNEIATAENTAIEISPESITSSNLDDINIWTDMKHARAITRKYYKSGPALCWNSEILTHCLFWASVIGLIIYGLPNLFLPAIALSLYLVRLMVQLNVINKSAKKLKVERFYFTLPLFDFFRPFVNIYFKIYRLIKGERDYTWK